RLGLATNGCLALTSAMRVVVGVHRRTANVRPTAYVAASAGFSDLDVLVIDIPDLAEGRQAAQVHHADLAGWHAELAKIIDLRHQLRRGSGRAAKLTALARVELDIVDLRTGRDVPKRQRVSGPDRGVLPGNDRVVHAKAQRRNNVPLLTIRVEQQRNPGR